MHIFGGFGIGRGPVYPGLPNGFFWATRDQQYGSKWYGEKVFWFVAAELSRARADPRPSTRWSGSGRLQRANGARHDELRVEPYDTVGWTGPAVTAAAASRRTCGSSRKGCYAFQIDGTSVQQ